MLKFEFDDSASASTSDDDQSFVYGALTGKEEPTKKKVPGHAIFKQRMLMKQALENDDCDSSIHSMDSFKRHQCRRINRSQRRQGASGRRQQNKAREESGSLVGLKITVPADSSKLSTKATPMSIRQEMPSLRRVSLLNSAA